MTDKCIESMLSEEALYERFILPGESHKHYANELLEIADELFLPESEAVGQFIRGVDTETRQSLIALGDSEEISTMAELLRRLMELQSNARTVKNKKTKKKRQVAVEVKKRAFWEAERRELHGELKDKLKKLRIENDIIMRAEDSLNIIIEPPPVEEADQPISHSNSFALDGPLSTDQAIRRALTDEVLGRSKRKGNQLSATEETREPDPDDDNDDSMWVDIDSDAGSSVWSLNSVLPPEGSSSSSSSSESETAEARTQMTECKESVVVTAKLPDDYPYKNEAPPSRRPRSHFVVSTSGPRRSIEPPWYNIIHAQGLYEECLKQQRTQPKKASGWPLRAPMMRPKRKDRNHRCYRLREGLHCATERVEAKKPVVEPRLSVYRPIDYSLEKAIAEEFLRGMNKLGDPRMEHTFGKREGDRLLSVLPAL
ncbi:hypothetical protein FOL47_005794 [Perkinsus chesapeaki]|uniref:Uncharacterized protein n=1 Tax=Perkinsus chesapeaki TaxID=330153 RepID=A0A7J6N0L3_PERCH|nr:hypothetical protein FOL47_005794 [Perkinsus chesapeaki]